MIYIISTFNRTGGTELIHQFVKSANDLLPHSVKVFYIGGAIDIQINLFKEYIVDPNYVMHENINDNIDNVIIVPETLTFFLRRFKYVQKAVWWMSVDNYFLNYGNFIDTINGRILMFLRRIKRRYYYCNNALTLKELKLIKYHFSQSYYSTMIIRKKICVEPIKLSDYINTDLIIDNCNIGTECRENIILYNPKKGIKITNQVIRYFRKRYDNNKIQFIPLENFNKEQLKTMFRKSKIYIDFGYHPGKDRLPREACSNGCIIITNRLGSAANDYDIPIQDEFKVDTSMGLKLDEILKLIVQVLNNYSHYNILFNSYRDKIMSEKMEFKFDVENVLNVLSFKSSVE